MKFEDIAIFEQVCAFHHQAVPLPVGVKEASEFELFGEILVNVAGCIDYRRTTLERVGRFEFGRFSRSFGVNADQLKQVEDGSGEFP